MRTILFVIILGFASLSLANPGWTQKNTLQDEGMTRWRVYKAYTTGKIIRPLSLSKATYEGTLTDAILGLTTKYTFTKDTTKIWNGLKQIVYIDKDFVITELYNPKKMIKQGGILLGAKPVVMIRRK